MQVRWKLNGNVVRPIEEVRIIWVRLHEAKIAVVPHRLLNAAVPAMRGARRRAVARQRERFAAHYNTADVRLTLRVRETKQTLSSGTASNAEAASQLNPTRT
jgi:hypothetical protein